VLERLWAAGHAAHVVGGSVRDALLGIPTGDWDVATDARPERILELFPGGTYENRFGTVLVDGVEVTTFRREHRYADHRRPDRVVFSDSLDEDLARRDFTVNAIAWGRAAGSAETGFVDPHHGRADLRAGVLRAVGDPEARFEEDALRLLRAARIAAATGLRIEPSTLRAMSARAADAAWVSAERVGSEVRRMLAARPPSTGLRILGDTGVLRHVLPELAAARLDHALAATDAAAERSPGDEGAVLAALLHDVPAGPGRARTPLRRALDRLRVPVREARRLERIVAAWRSGPPAGEGDEDLRRYVRRVGPDVIDAVLRLREAHEVASGLDPGTSGLSGLRARIEAQRAAGVALAVGDLAVDGDDLQGALGLGPGPAIGRLLDALLERVIVDPGLNRREALLAEARRVAAADGEAARTAAGRPGGTGEPPDMG
jgi:tRNA nucleotidyltransferase (CCA-adding enzyme)